MQYFTDWYNKSIDSNSESGKIKWSRDLKKRFAKKQKGTFDNKFITNMIYRPFVKKKHYSSKMFNDILTDNHYKMFGKNLNKNNLVFHFSGIGHNKTFTSLAYNSIFSLDSVEKGQSIPLKLYHDDDNETENVTNWALGMFKETFKDETISKKSIFYYVFACLNDPTYRKKYKENVSLEFPKIPLHTNFWKWSNWGLILVEIQSEYENAKPHEISRIENGINTKNLKTIFKTDKIRGEIKLDEVTTLIGIPIEAFEYQLGIRSAIDWILNQYKVKAIKDETISQMFNNYKYIDNKEHIISLIQKVITVSLQTLEIMNQMKKESHLVKSVV